MRFEAAEPCPPAWVAPHARRCNQQGAACLRLMEKSNYLAAAQKVSLLLAACAARSWDAGIADVSEEWPHSRSEEICARSRAHPASMQALVERCAHRRMPRRLGLPPATLGHDHLILRSRAWCAGGCARPVGGRRLLQGLHPRQRRRSTRLPLAQAKPPLRPARNRTRAESGAAPLQKGGAGHGMQ